MANDVIDTLSLEINSSAKNADKAVDNLIGKLNRLGGAVDKFKTGNFDGLKQFSQQSKEATKGISDFAKSADELRKKYAELGKGLTFSGSLKQLQGQLTKYQNLMNSAKLKEQSLFSAGKVDTKGYDDAVRAASAYSNVVKGLEAQIKSLSAESEKVKPLGDFTIEGLDGGSVKKLADFQKELAEYRKVISEGGYETESGRTMPYSSMLISLQQLREAFPLATAEMQEFESILQKAGVGTNFEQVRQGIQSVGKETSDVSEIIDRMQRKFSQLGAGFTFKGNASELENALSAATQKFDDLLAKEQEFINSGKSLNSPEFEGIQKQIAETSNQLEILNKKKQDWDAFKSGLGNLSIPPINTDSLKRLESELAREEARLEKFKAKLQNDISMGRITTNTDDAGFHAAEEQIALSEKTIEALRERIQSVDSAAGKTQGINRLGSAFSNLSAAGKDFKKALSGILSSIKKFYAGVGTLAKKLFDLRKGMSGVLSASNKNNISFNKGLNTVLKYGFGIRSLYFLFRRLRSAITEGFEHLAQYSSEVNASISSMSSALLRFKNALSVAFAPIVNVVAPYITAFINMISDALNAVGRFFSTLTGKKFAPQATKVYKDYAQGLTNSGNAADKAADSQKKLNKQLELAPYDELNVLNRDNDDTGGAAGIGGGIGDIADGAEKIEDMFDTVGAANEWAKKLRDAFLDKDWERLGSTLADGLNKGLKKVYDALDWNKNGPKILAFTNGLTRTLNSLVDKFDWDMLGRTIGRGVNTITRTLNSIIGEGGFDFRNLGRKLSVGFRGMVDEIDWPELGNFIGNKFMMAWKVFHGFVDDMWREDDITGLTGWQEFGNGLGDAINGIFDKIDFSEIALTVTGFINGVFQSLLNFTERVKWEDIRKNVSDGLNTAFTNMKWEDAGKSLNEFLSDLGDFMLGVAKDVKWEEFGKGIADFLGAIDWGKHFNTVIEILKEVVGGIWEGLGDTFAGKVVQGIIAFKITSSTLLPFADGLAKAFTGKSLTQVVAGGVKGLLGGAFGESGILDGGMFSSLASAISPATVAIGALATGLGYVFATNEQVRQSFSDAVTALQAGFQPVLQTITETIIPGLQSAWQGFIDIMTPFGEFLQTAFTSIWQDVLNPALQYTGDTILPTLAETFGNLWNNVLVPLGEFLGSVFSPAVEILSTGLTTLWQNVVEPLAGAVGGILSTAFEGIAQVLNNTVIPAVGLVVDAVNALWKNVLSPIGTFLTKTFAPVFDSVFKGIGDLIEDLQGVFQGLIDFITGVFSGDWGKAWNGIKTTFSNAVGGLGDILKTPVNAAIGFLNGLINAVEWAVNSVANMLNHLNVQAPKWFSDLTGITSLGFNLPTWNAPNIPYLAKGGLAVKETYAKIREGKDDEAVLPLNDSVYERLATGITKNMPKLDIGSVEINRSQAPYVTTTNIPRSTYSDSFGDDMRRDIAAISSNTFNNNTNIGQAVKEALNGMAVVADGYIIGYLQSKNMESRNQNGGLGIFEV